MSTFFSGLFVFSSPPEKSHPITISIEWLFQLSIWSFTLIISFQDYFRILPDCFDPLFCFHLLSCPGKDRQFCFFCDFSFPDPVTLLLTFRSFPTMIKISSSHWTFPPFPETFMCLFRFDVFILQYLFLFVNSFLKIYLYFFNYLCFYPGVYSK